MKSFPTWILVGSLLPYREVGNSRCWGRLQAQAFEGLHLLREEISRADYTIETDRGDTLVARWDVSGGKNERALWLWDAPVDSVVVIQTGPGALASAQFTRYCEDLIAWEGSGTWSLRLQYLQSGPGELSVAGTANQPDW